SHELSAVTIVAVSFGVVITTGLWWTYFGHFAASAESRLRGHDDPVLAASDAYSYLHLLLVAGIIVFAVGARALGEHAGQPMPAALRLALCGGVALYLLGLAVVRRRLAGDWGVERLAGSALLIGVFAVTGGLAAWALACVVAALLALVCGVE